MKKQVEESLFHLDAATVQKVVIAYEPVWAIGTGKTATAQQAQDMACCDPQSTLPPNTASLLPMPFPYSTAAGGRGQRKGAFACPDVDGGLVGGASLKSRDFTEIIKSI